MRSKLVASFFVAIAVLAVGSPAPVAADPPPWAPAHGYRKKKEREPEVVVVQPSRRDCGRLDNQAIGSTAGAAGGALLGDAVAGRGRDDRLVGSVAGAAGGALLGGLVGQSSDRARGC